MDYMALGLGLLLGGIVCFLVFKLYYLRSSQALKEALTSKSTILEQNAISISSKEKEIQVLQHKNVELLQSNAALEADYRNLQEKLSEQKLEISELQASFSKEFKLIANQILEEKSEKFTLLNKKNLDTILSPLKENILRFEGKIEKTNQDHIAKNAALQQQIADLKTLNEQINKEAYNLTRALKGDTKIQGTWGEMILEKLLEQSGLKKGVEYKTQVRLKGEDNKVFQPDVVLYLPEQKEIVIDSKVALVHYESFVSAEEEELRSQYLKQHLNAIKQHFNKLSDKNYQQLYGITSLDFVLMFVPVEPALSLAFQSEPGLFHDAYQKNVVMVGPSTLMATLKTIATLWRQENQNKFAFDIARESGALYDKFVGFSKDLMDIGKTLDSSQKAYEKAMNKLTTGKGNLVSKAEKIKELGAKNSKTLPNPLLHSDKKK